MPSAHLAHENDAKKQGRCASDYNCCGSWPTFYVPYTADTVYNSYTGHCTVALLLVEPIPLRRTEKFWVLAAVETARTDELRVELVSVFLS